ncbi:MAG: hypothetical protein JSW54_05710 [Fidelibacterota bacterium]|nr:MAG: hypothetical protein JSW54_05710 [Candidatus Neomarinimicrobiota bacterium]
MEEDILAIIGGVSFMITIVIAVIVALYLNFRKRQVQSREIMAAIEKGIEVPFPPPKQRNYRNQGLFWSAIGIALFLGIWVSSKALAGAIWGLLPLLVGAAFILIYYLEKKEEASS